MYIRLEPNDFKNEPLEGRLGMIRIYKDKMKSREYQNNPLLGLTHKMDVDMCMKHLETVQGVMKLKDSRDFGGRNIIFEYNIGKGDAYRKVKFYIRVEKGKKKKYWIEFMNVSDYYFKP